MGQLWLPGWVHDLDACPDLFAVSVCDAKPVHILLSTAAECVEWIVKERQV